MPDKGFGRHGGNERFRRVGRLLDRKTVAELLALHVQIGEELRSRSIVRSANSLTGDLAEYLFCTAFGWKRAPNSKQGYDAEAKDGTRYQIMGRRIHRRNSSRQLAAIRNLADEHFKVLAAVLFDDGFQVKRAALVPREVVEKEATYNKHTNSHRFILRDSVWSIKGVTDSTQQIKKAERTMNELVLAPDNGE